MSAVVAPEHQHLVFEYLYSRHGADLDYVLIERPKQIKLAFFHSKRSGELVLMVTRQILLEYLDVITSELRTLLKHHSPFYWLYLYRRIRPILHPGHINKTDEITTLLVREIAELAIFKFGDVSCTSDVKRSSQVSFTRAWGGFLERAISAFPKGRREMLREFMLRDYQENDTFIPDSFKSTDLRDAYAVEGLAYEYWLATARLRSVGKGSRLYFHEDGQFLYEPDEDLEEVISRYDARLSYQRFFSTLIGVVSEVKAEEDAIKSLLLLVYNVGGVNVDQILEKLKFPVKSATGTPIANFIPEFLNVTNFSAAHSYLDAEFVDKWGFSVSEFGYILWSLTNLALLPNTYLAEPDKLPFGVFFLRLLKRGYVIYSVEGEEKWASLRERLEMWMNLQPEILESTIEKAPSVISMLSLSKSKQELISLWSRGPRPIIVPYGDFVVIDVAGLASFLPRLFTGIRDDGQVRGDLFEETVRAAVAVVLPDSWHVGTRLFRQNGEQKHEADVVLVTGDAAYIGECFTMWMPLNFDIGDEATIATRLKRVDEKLDQVKEVCDFLRLNPVGDNYDFSAVNKFVPIVVSPFVEWLPSTSERYWLAKDRPRVMSIDEFVDFVQDGGLGTPPA